MRRVELTADALRQFKGLPKNVRALMKEAIRRHLLEQDPAETTRNKFRLRRLSRFADYELSTGDWRIFHRLDGHDVIITLFGEKRGSRLIVEGEELML